MFNESSDKDSEQKSAAGGLKHLRIIWIVPDDKTSYRWNINKVEPNIDGCCREVGRPEMEKI